MCCGSRGSSRRQPATPQTLPAAARARTGPRLKHRPVQLRFDAPMPRAPTAPARAGERACVAVLQRLDGRGAARGALTRRDPSPLRPDRPSPAPPPPRASQLLPPRAPQFFKLVLCVLAIAVERRSVRDALGALTTGLKWRQTSLRASHSPGPHGLLGGTARLCEARSAVVAGWGPRVASASSPQSALNMTVLATHTWLKARE